MTTLQRLLVFTLLSGPSFASGQQALASSEDDGLRLGFGGRVGGYGFRDISAGETSWTECRMDGVGVFTSVDMTSHFFGEVSLDYYQAHASAVEHGMDRESGHLLAAVGARMFPDLLLTPHVQLGGGAEWTKVELREGPSREAWLPAGFIGFGGELNLTAHLKAGANVRMFLLAHPTHADHDHDPSADDTVPLDYTAAGQAQFFLRYAL